MTHALLVPATAGTALCAIGVTLWWWSGHSIDLLVVDDRARVGAHGGAQIWRFVTSAFPHVDLWHLAFNLYWLWVFGTVIEEVYGCLRLSALMLFLAVGSSMGQCAATLEGGVGLSGVVYGLCTYLAVAGRSSPRLRDIVDRQTLTLFAVWFVLCAVLTAFGMWQVANGAHGAGAVLGAMLGGFATLTGRFRWVCGGLLCVAMLALGYATACPQPWLLERFARPEVNAYLLELAACELEQKASEAAAAGDNERAERWYREAMSRCPNARRWFGLGCVLQRQERYTEAVDAFQRAVDTDSSRVEYREALESLRSFLARR